MAFLSVMFSLISGRQKSGALTRKEIENVLMDSPFYTHLSMTEKKEMIERIRKTIKKQNKKKMPFSQRIKKRMLLKMRHPRAHLAMNLIKRGY